LSLSFCRLTSCFRFRLGLAPSLRLFDPASFFCFSDFAPCVHLGDATPLCFFSRDASRLSFRRPQRLDLGGPFLLRLDRSPTSFLAHGTSLSGFLGAPVRFLLSQRARFGFPLRGTRGQLLSEPNDPFGRLSKSGDRATA
jgi:hypothetical protein